jgi:hypothetical protein
MSTNHPAVEFGKEKIMLSSTSRALTYLSALGYLLVGTTLFLAPSWSAGQFPWNASPFVVMTIGGWCLGNAVFAWQSARSWDWRLTYPSLIYLWLFAIFEAAVMFAFRAKVHTDSVIAVSYLAMVGVNVLNALSALPLVWARNLTPMFSYGLAGVVLIVPILIAAFLNLDKFDFGGRPGGILYIGSYLFTLAVTAWGVWHHRPALRRTERILG